MLFVCRSEKDLFGGLQLGLASACVLVLAGAALTRRAGGVGGGGWSRGRCWPAVGVCRPGAEDAAVRPLGLGPRVRGASRLGLAGGRGLLGGGLVGVVACGLPLPLRLCSLMAVFGWAGPALGGCSACLGGMVALVYFTVSI